MYVVKIVHTPAIIALSFCIVGATSATSLASIEAQDTVRAGIILYIVVFVMLLLLAVLAWWSKHSTAGVSINQTRFKPIDTYPLRFKQGEML